jgi:methyltransferase
VTTAAVFLPLLALTLLQRLLELGRARRNLARLLARGGREVGQGHYPLLVAAHVLFYLVWTAEVLWRRPAPGTATAAWLGVYVLAQVGRASVLRTLGDRWTTRVVVVPGEPLVRHGLYRWLRHPNYVIVVIELGALAQAFQARFALLAAVLGQALVLTVRVRVEERALGPYRAA